MLVGGSLALYTVVCSKPLAFDALKSVRTSACTIEAVTSRHGESRGVSRDLEVTVIILWFESVSVTVVIAIAKSLTRGMFLPLVDVCPATHRSKRL